MVKKKEFFIERTEGDDILDALSLRVNETLKTEKKVDDKKNNVYFWLFKFIILMIYLLFINVIFLVVEDVVIDFIYYFSVSLRGIVSGLWSTVISFSRLLITLYILYKNLKIFMASTYYRRLYSNDKEMNAKKKKFFGIISTVLKYLSVPFLVFVSFISAVVLAFFTMLGYLLLNGIYSVSSILIILCLFAICYSIFKNIQNRFFNVGSGISKRSLTIMLVMLLFSIVLFIYETGSYDYSDTLPGSFTLEEKTMYFDITSRNDVILQSGSKYDNMHVYIDNTLENEIRIELEYFETADVEYTYYFNEDDDLHLKFNSNLDFSMYDFEHVLKLGVETLKNQTLYNYNLFKYPTISVYINHDDFDKVILLDYKNDEKDLAKD